MSTDWELEDWILAAGERAERAWMAGGDAALSPTERLVREVWLFDVEAVNGGVSQYFANHPPTRWRALRGACEACGLASLRPVIEHVERVIAGAADPYLPTLDAGPEVDAAYAEHRPAILAEL